MAVTLNKGSKTEFCSLHQPKGPAFGGAASCLYCGHVVHRLLRRTIKSVPSTMQLYSAGPTCTSACFLTQDYSQMTVTWLATLHIHCLRS